MTRGASDYNKIKIKRIVGQYLVSGGCIGRRRTLATIDYSLTDDIVSRVHSERVPIERQARILRAVWA
jgi:hypothetical protein